MVSRRSSKPSRKKYWNLIEDKVVHTVRQFFSSGRLPQSLNRTNIVLVPKVLGPEEIGQFRPISLCNYSYKICSRVMVNRLKPFISQLISNEQSAFVPNRQIQDNFFIAHEVFNYLRRKKKGKVFEAAIKIDMCKAYDRVEWDFLKALLLQMGFVDGWVKLIMQCVSSVSYSIVLNGEHLEYFVPQRGLRKGDPLSPYLFILVTEALNSLLCTAKADGIISGIKLSKSCPDLTHLLFADDSLFFTKLSNNGAHKLMEIINKYCYASGQLVNLNKSGAFFSSNTPQSVRSRVANQLHITALSQIGKYLGIESQWGRNKSQMLEYIVERVLMKVSGWKEQLLSQAGKEVLIKYVLQAIPYYVMSIFKFPKKVCYMINASIANFWWQSGKESSGIHWTEWKKLTCSKNGGGMGFKSFEDMNIALLAKQVWRMNFNPQALWVKVLKAVYFPNVDIWSANMGSHASWCWRSLIEGRNFLKREVLWQIGDGLIAKVWIDKWIPGVGVLFGYEAEGINVVADLIVEGCWNEELVHSIFPVDLACRICAIPLPSRVCSDKIG